VVTATVYIAQCFSVVCVVYFGYSNSRYSAMVLCCVRVYCGCRNSRCSAMFLCCGRRFFVVTASIDIVQ